MAQYTNITETAHIVGLSVTCLRRGVHSGRFPYIRSERDNPRSKLFFDVQEVAQVLASETIASMHHKKEAEKND